MNSWVPGFMTEGHPRPSGRLGGGCVSAAAEPWGVRASRPHGATHTEGHSAQWPGLRVTVSTVRYAASAGSLCFASAAGVRCSPLRSYQLVVPKPNSAAAARPTAIMTQPRVRPASPWAS